MLCGYGAECLSAGGRGVEVGSLGEQVVIVSVSGLWFADWLTGEGGRGER